MKNMTFKFDKADYTKIHEEMKQLGYKPLRVEQFGGSTRMKVEWKKTKKLPD